MENASHRLFKNRLYGLFARIGKALSNPHRLEMLELLAQGERTVDSLASEMGLSVANASQHLQALRQAALVDSRKDGLFVHYRLAAPGVFELSKAIRTVAEDRLADLDRLVREPGCWLVEQEDARTVQKSFSEFQPPLHAAGKCFCHIPGAISVPVDELNRRLKQLPKGKEYVAYCRGPYCVYADRAVELLLAKGRRARRLKDGFPEWRAAGLPVAAGEEPGARQ